MNEFLTREQAPLKFLTRWGQKLHLRSKIGLNQTGGGIVVTGCEIPEIWWWSSGQPDLIFRGQGPFHSP